MRTETEIWKEAQRRRVTQPQFGSEGCDKIIGFFIASAFVLGLNTDDFCKELDRRIKTEHLPIQERFDWEMGRHGDLKEKANLRTIDNNTESLDKSSSVR